LKSTRIKAAALTYAIFILLITTIVIGTLITIAFYHRNYLEQEIARQKLISYTHSVLTAAVYDSTLSFPWDGKSLDLTPNHAYRFQVLKSKWGGLAILDIEGVYGNFTTRKKVLCGAKGVGDDATALYLADNYNSIAVSGKTRLVGDCYLPKSGIKASYMEGDYYRGKELVYGTIKESSSQLPSIDKDYLQWVNQMLEGKLKPTDSVIDFASIQSSEFSNGFYQKTAYFLSTEPLYLNRCKFDGNIVILSLHPITVFPSAELTDVMLFAPKITFEKNWFGAVQAYAKDTLIAESNVHFQFPSVLGVSGSQNLGFIDLQRGARIEGALWMTKNTQVKDNKNTCYFQSNTYLQGAAHIEGKVALQGEIAGALYTEKFFLKTASSYYENHLFNVEINAFKRSPYLSTALLDKSRSLKIIKYLEP
jgi:hypothetical protein